MLTRIFYFFIFKNEKIKENLKKVFLCFYSFILLFFVLEAVFMFVPQSHGVGYTHASYNWHYYYWKPISRFHYRDKDCSIKEVINKQKIFALGDSSTAGAGIKNIEDRYSDLLEKKLPSNYKVFNLGMPGSDTKYAYHRLVSFPFRPDILILQYAGDDILGAALSKGKSFPVFTPYENVKKLFRPIIRYSYVIDFIYWQFPQADTSTYLNFQVSSYKDKEILKEHFADLSRILKFCKKNNVSLIVMMIPYLHDLEKTESFTMPIGRFFRGKGIPVIDVSDIIRKIPLRKRIVSYNDPHPSVMVHRLMAEEIYRILVSEKMIELSSRKTSNMP
ncbi:MAG: SGNH/GDSL hydrolase family protein [Elusimicrobia bacterium]|nr:SGNH/GDSL hydrolase family protein [Elusimicrobiota bacterium]